MPPPKPGWLVEIQDGGEGRGVVVDVEVRPRTKVAGTAAGKAGAAGGGVDGKGDQRKAVVVVVDGKEEEVAVVGEKESLTGLGREELLDDRVSRMGVLSRCVFVLLTPFHCVFGSLPLAYTAVEHGLRFAFLLVQRALLTAQRLTMCNPLSFFACYPSRVCCYLTGPRG